MAARYALKPDVLKNLIEMYRYCTHLLWRELEVDELPKFGWWQLIPIRPLIEFAREKKYNPELVTVAQEPGPISEPGDRQQLEHARPGSENTINRIHDCNCRSKKRRRCDMARNCSRRPIATRSSSGAARTNQSQRPTKRNSPRW